MGLWPHLADDMLYGAEAIRDYLGIQPRDRRGLKKVYYLRERRGWPIFYLDGVGIAARKSSLRAFVARQERDRESAP